MNSPALTRFLIACIPTLGVFAFSVFGSEEPLQEERGFYYFIGGELSAQRGSGHYSVVEVTKKRILVDIGTGVKKVWKEAPAIIRLKPVVADSLVDVIDLDVSFSSSLPALIEARAMSDMMRQQVGTDVEIITVPRVYRGGKGFADINAIESINQKNVEFQERLRDQAEEASREAEVVVDTAHVKFSLLPERDYQNAYAAVELSYNVSRDGATSRRSQVQIKYIGNLNAGQIEEVKARINLPLAFEEGAKCELFLYSEKGAPIATNLSRAVKAITPEKAREFGAGR